MPKLFGNIKREKLKQEAWQLKVQGIGYRRIAERLSISLGEAHKLVKEVLNESIKQRNLDTLEWRLTQLGLAEEMVDVLSQYTMMERRGKKGMPKEFVPNLDVIKEIREWKKFEAELTGTKHSELNINLNAESLAQKLRAGLTQMDESAG